MSSEMDDYVTVSEAAPLVGVTEDAIRKAIRTSKLPATRKFGRLLMQRGDLFAWDGRRRFEIGRPPKHKSAEMERQEQG